MFTIQIVSNLDMINVHSLHFIHREIYIKKITNDCTEKYFLYQIYVEGKDNVSNDKEFGHSNYLSLFCVSKYIKNEKKLLGYII